LKNKSNLFTIYSTNCLFNSAYNNKDGTIFVWFCIFLVSDAFIRDQERLQQPIRTNSRPFDCSIYKNKYSTNEPQCAFINLMMFFELLLTQWLSMRQKVGIHHWAQAVVAHQHTLQ